MPRPLWICVVLLCAISVPCIHGQNAAPTPSGLLTGVLAGLNSANLHDATQTSSSEFIAGKTDETGTFTAQTAVNGYHRLQLVLPNSSRTDVRTPQNGSVVGTWLDAQGVQHTVAEHNLLVDHSWFFPAIALARLLQSPQAVFSFVGTETKNGISVEHFTMTDVYLPNGTLSNPKLAHIEQRHPTGYCEQALVRGAS